MTYRNGNSDMRCIVFSFGNSQRLIPKAKNTTPNITIFIPTAGTLGNLFLPLSIKMIMKR